jgi:hypothetical protein
LSVLNLAENNLGESVLPEGWTEDYDEDEESVYKHTDGREQKDSPSKPEGIIAIVNAIPDMRAISSVNLLKNDITVEQAEDLVSILKEHPALKSLCGNKGDETELDMSGKMSGAGDAIMLAAEIVDNGALTSLNISDNKLTRGVYSGSGYRDHDGNYATDRTGMCIFIARKLFSDAMMLQVLLSLPMSSPI